MDNIKIVFTDLDGTLTYAPGKIDIQNEEALKKLEEIGIPVVLNTGRSLPYAIPICKNFSFSNYVITSNGAEVYNIAADKMIYRSVISKENIDKLCELIEKNNLYFTANGPKRRYSNKTMENVGLIYYPSLKDVKDEISQVVIESYNMEDMIAFKNDLQELPLKIINKTNHITKNKLLYYDIVNSDVSKGNAIVTLCNYLNIDLKRTMAIGDSLNDIDMFNVVGYKIAVSNAKEELKALADTITLSNTENGVLIVLNELYSQLK